MRREGGRSAVQARLMSEDSIKFGRRQGTRCVAETGLQVTGCEQKGLVGKPDRGVVQRRIVRWQRGDPRECAAGVQLTELFQPTQPQLKTNFPGAGSVYVRDDLTGVAARITAVQARFSMGTQSCSAGPI